MRHFYAVHPGRTLLIAGAPKPESPAVYQACLPAGGWYDYWTGAKVSGSPAGDGSVEQMSLTPRLDLLPVFVRAGSVIPRQPPVQSTSERPDGPLELNIYPGPGCAGEIYDDDGHSLGFTRGAYLRQKVSCGTGGQGLSSVRIEPQQGSYKPWWSKVRIVIHGSGHFAARLGGKKLAVEFANGASSFEVPVSRSGMTVQLVQSP